MGLIGGGRGAFIGPVHARAACQDGRAELVAGALSSEPRRARESAAELGVVPDRAYGSYLEMADAEARRPAAERIDFVTVATPNDTHFEIARAFVRAGVNVVCDKPMTTDLAQAEELARLVRESGIVFALTHNYTGYPLVRQARDMVRGGELGEIQAVRACYIQGWLRTRLEEEGHKQAAWRTDPARAGPVGCLGDIGTHAYNLARFITGLLPESVSCLLRTFERGRRLDDYCAATIRYDGGALGTLCGSQVSHGRENDLRIEVDGTKAALEWRQEEPNRMLVRTNGRPHRLYTRDPNAEFMSPTARASCRLPAGHPEGFIEAFANVYMAAFDDMVARACGEAVRVADSLYPNVADGVDGVNFVTQCVASSAQGGLWVPLRHMICTR